MRLLRKRLLRELARPAAQLETKPTSVPLGARGFWPNGELAA